MKTRKLCIITGSRAEWGLFYPLACEIIKSRNDFLLQIIATGAHLSKEYGLTYKEIEEDGFNIDYRVKIPLAKDDEIAITRSIGTSIAGLTKALARLNPDLVILIGDRVETYSAALASFLMKIPIAHIHGGELTEGSLDNALRHGITKFSHIHFAAAEPYKQRIIQMGEDPQHVFCVGAIALDNIKRTKLLEKEELEERLRFKLTAQNMLVTYNSVTLQTKTSVESEFKNLLSALDELKGVNIIFTMPNPDLYSKALKRKVEEYVNKNRKRCIAFTSMGRELYLSTIRFMSMVVGNSSSGIIEVPSFGIPTVNIGTRQAGRIRARSVINSGPDKTSISRAISTALSKDFAKLCRNVSNPYDGGNTSQKIVDILKRMKIDKSLLVKRFHDICR